MDLAAIFALSLGTAAVADTSAQHTATDEPSQCVSLDGEWRRAEASCATNVNLGRARALAREAQSKCKSSEPAQGKLAVGKYQSEMRLCRRAAGQ